MLIDGETILAYTSKGHPLVADKDGSIWVIEAVQPVAFFAGYYAEVGKAKFFLYYAVAQREGHEAVTEATQRHAKKLADIFNTRMEWGIADFSNGPIPNQIQRLELVTLAPKIHTEG